MAGDKHDNYEPERFFIPYDLRFSRFAHDRAFRQMRNSLLDLSPEYHHRTRPMEPKAQMAHLLSEWVIEVHQEEKTCQKSS